MGQLPTYILFDNATEIVRYPELDYEAKYFQPTITKVFILSRTLRLAVG